VKANFVTISDTKVCSAPVVVAGKLDTKNNIEIGKVFRAECDTSKFFKFLSAPFSWSVVGKEARKEYGKPC
jgi:hypothetical protein